MAAPQFFTPRPVRPSRPKRRFTLQEANRALPLVRRVVGDVVKAHTEAVALQGGLESASGKEQVRLQGQLDATMHRLEDFVDELSEIGCDLKDYQTGLIDFIGRHQGRDVCLCWKLGEETIAYWHELDSGFAGRQPASILQEDT